jgi:hypothetical protein
LGYESVPTNILFAVTVVAALLVLLKFVLSTKARTSTHLRYERIDLFNSTEHAFRRLPTDTRANYEPVRANHSASDPSVGTSTSSVSPVLIRVRNSR